MQIDQIHITHIYSGLLACSNIRKFNERYLSAIEDHARVYLGDHIPLHVILLSSVPDTLPRYMVTILLNGTPIGREEECDDKGDTYHGHWLGVVQFIDSPTSHEIDLAIQDAKTVFDIHAKGYFF